MLINKRRIALCAPIVLGCCLLSSVAQSADNDSDRNSHQTVDNTVTPEERPEAVEPDFEPSCGSPTLIQNGEFIWSDTDVVLKGRPTLALTRHYQAFNAREGLFGKGWSTRCEKSLTRVVGFVDSEGNTTSEPLIKYVYRIENGKVYEFAESAPDVFMQPDGLPERTLTLLDDGARGIRYIDGSSESYNSLGQLIAEVDRNGNAVNYTYEDSVLSRMADENGRYLQLGYDSDGHVTSVSDHTGRMWQYAYNADGSLASVTDPAGGVMQYAYMPVQRAADANIYPAITSINDESGVVVISVTYEESGRVASYTMGENTYTYTRDASFYYKTDSQRSRWSYATDAFGRKSQETPPINNRRSMLYEYDDNGNITKFTDLAGTEFEYDYDDLGRLVSTTTPDGTSTLTYQGSTDYVASTTSVSGRTNTFSYDSRGNPTRIVDPLGNASTMTWNSNGDPTSVTDPLGNTTTQTYNVIGLVTQTTDPLGRTTTFAYDALGNLTEITDPAGSVTTMTYDELDRMTGSTDALGHVTQYAYDAADRLLSVTDNAGGVTAFTYDIHGRKASETRADNSTFTYAYRSDNLLSSTTDPRGVVTSYTYDAGKRVTRITAGSDAYSYTYDVFGKVLSGRSNASSVGYTYDTLYRVLTETQDGRMTTYTYNNESELVGLNYLQEDLLYTYDERGLLTSFTTPSGTHNYAYDAAGRLTSHTRPNGNVATMAYDGAYQLLNQDYSAISGEDFRYDYDDLGRITSIVGDGAADWTYQYDLIHRLTGATHQDSYDYQYDSLGNRLENGGIFDLFNKLLEDNEFTYTYDEMGSLISKVSKSTGEQTRYSYNSFARLTGVEIAPSVDALATTRATYDYDAFGRRAVKTVNGEATRFRWKSSDLIAEYGASGEITAHYRYDGDYTAAEFTQDGETYDVLSDYLGSAKRLVDQAGNIGWRNPSDPYGEETSSLLSAPSAVEFNQRFPGQYFDAESALSYNVNRYYKPETGAYIRSDPIGLAAGLNQYIYANSMPTHAFDPYGLRARVRCRLVPIIGILTGARHCYIEREQDGTVTTWGLIGDTGGPASVSGTVYCDNSFDSGGISGSWNEDPEVDACVEREANSYPSPSNYTFATGPNSNTFAGTVARACGLSKPKGIGFTPGWNDLPATPYVPKEKEGKGQYTSPGQREVPRFNQ